VGGAESVVDILMLWTGGDGGWGGFLEEGLV